jgi:hypothetical protein
MGATVTSRLFGFFATLSPQIRGTRCIPAGSHVKVFCIVLYAAKTRPEKGVRYLFRATVRNMKVGQFVGKGT